MIAIMIIIRQRNRLFVRVSVCLYAHVYVSPLTFAVMVQN